jgi:hypothetical protein
MHADPVRVVIESGTIERLVPIAGLVISAVAALLTLRYVGLTKRIATGDSQPEIRLQIEDHRFLIQNFGGVLLDAEIDITLISAQSTNHSHRFQQTIASLERNGAIPIVYPPAAGSKEEVILAFDQIKLEISGRTLHGRKYKTVWLQAILLPDAGQWSDDE